MDFIERAHNFALRKHMAHLLRLIISSETCTIYLGKIFTLKELNTLTD